MTKKKTGKSIVKETVEYFSDPAMLEKLTKEELIKLNEATESALEELTAQRAAVRAVLLDKIKGDGEIIGGKAYTRIKIYNFDVGIEKAKELGATKIIPAKEVVDKSALKKLLMRGVKIKHEIVERLMIREIKKK